MSLYGMMRTSVSGMSAQANLLSTVGDNIANASTTGYKAASAEFSSVMLQNDTSGGNYSSGSVETTISYDVSTQGELTYTESTTDLAIEGDGFFLVSDGNGGTLLTRAGDFTLDASTNTLVNSSGYTLLGYAYNEDGTVDTTQLVEVDIDKATVTATASATGTFSAQLPSSATDDGEVVGSSSLTVYDTLGSAHSVTMSFEKTSADGVTPSTWTLEVSEDGTTLATATLAFDEDGNLDSSSDTEITITLTNTQSGTNDVTLDLSGMTQKDMDYTVLTSSVDGNAASVLSDISIDTDGTVYAVNSDGDQFAIFQIPLGYVTSPDNLTTVTGNAYQVNSSSGALQIGTADTNGLGSIVSGATEGSTVDTATELTTMIIAQRDYTANSKVFQTGSELLEVLMNLKR